MAIYTLVYFETNRIEREVEAATLEEAIDGEKVYDAGLQAQIEEEQ